LYLVYNYAIFAFSVVMNPLSAVYIAILGLAIWSLLIGTTRPGLEHSAQPVTERLARRSSAGLLIGVAALFGLLWLGQIASTTASGIVPPELVRAGVPANPVYALDLAFFLPLCAVAGLGLIRRDRGAAFAVAMLIWVPLMSAGVLGGFVLAAAAGEAVPIAVVAVIGGVGVASAILAVVPLVRGRARGLPKATRSAVA
jgi:hypothetical protein